ncbi:helix-turn-helix domain-containing protein [Pseudomonas sp. SLFW]|uniref:helix-turn-helix domain-containing protein n=1 Tax=Pseudomonas sp. SLFW TaxID=2683259 RepID=UPI001412B260|nr:helix-turn-helix transcriptional regulator [Pseudomonas sp. SLFW]NBB11837.1 helix-turn-helix domain-containing protein [Pseudomonas sp. SLFW]
MLTEFGKLLRKIRIDKGMLLKDMAGALSISPAYLSAVETGKKPIPDGFVGRIASLFDYTVGSDEHAALEDSASMSKGEAPMKHLPQKHQQAVLAFARNLNHLSADDVEKVLASIKQLKMKAQ